MFKIYKNELQSGYRKLWAIIALSVALYLLGVAIVAEIFQPVPIQLWVLPYVLTVIASFGEPAQDDTVSMAIFQHYAIAILCSTVLLTISFIGILTTGALKWSMLQGQADLLLGGLILLFTISILFSLIVDVMKSTKQLKN